MSGGISFIKIGITPPVIFQDESEQIVNLLQSGIDYIHIRHPEESLEEITKLLNQIPETLRQRLTLHDHFEIIDCMGVGGIHLNKRNPSMPLSLPGERRKYRVSRSCHSIEEVENSDCCDYVTLSPIFDSISKKDYKSNFPQEKWGELKDFLLSQHVPVIALGGVTDDKVELLKELGFSGMAQLGSLWR